MRPMYIGEMTVHRKKGLAACPLCDNEAVFVEYHGGVFVKCSCCECMVAKQISITTENILPFETEEEAIKVWNRRNGVEVEAKNMVDKMSATDMLALRNKRVIKIINAIQKGRGDYVLVSEITEDTGLKKSIVNNTMQYIKKHYPNVKSTPGKAGYYWED